MLQLLPSHPTDSPLVIVVCEMTSCIICPISLLIGIKLVGPLYIPALLFCAHRVLVLMKCFKACLLIAQTLKCENPILLGILLLAYFTHFTLNSSFSSFWFMNKTVELVSNLFGFDFEGLRNHILLCCWPETCRSFLHSSRRGVCAFLSCPGAARPGVYIQVVPVLSCIRRSSSWQTIAFSITPGNNHQFMEGKGGEQWGTCHWKSKRYLAGFFLIK